MQGLEALLAFLELFDGGNEVGDVVIDPCHMNRLAMPVASDFGMGSDNARFSIRADNSELGVEFPLAKQRQLHLVMHALPILGMQSHLPCLVPTADGIPLEAVETEHPIIPFEPVFGEVVVPNAETGGIGGQLHPLIGPFDFVEGEGSLGDILVDTIGAHGHPLGVLDDEKAHRDVADLPVGVKYPVVELPLEVGVGRLDCRTDFLGD